MNILVAGGTGYIGSHTIVELLANGHNVSVVDNLANSSMGVISRIKKLSGKKPKLYVFDLCDKEATNNLFKKNSFDAVIHFAGLKAVGDSVQIPLTYYDNNLLSTISLLNAMLNNGVNKLIFSSSATVYGSANTVEYRETLPAGQYISNPYGRTKYMIEEIIKDISTANNSFEATILRYFNPIGAHESGEIGEDPLGPPNNLMPFITQVATGKRDELLIFGNDYPTEDGTCKRDYIHVVDLARGHLAALNKLKPGTHIYNLGSGIPTSVLQLVNTFSSVSGKSVKYRFAPRREGDLAEFYADSSKAELELGWKVEKSIEDMCRDTWNWQLKNPNGYDG